MILKKNLEIPVLLLKKGFRNIFAHFKFHFALFSFNVDFSALLRVSYTRSAVLEKPLIIIFNSFLEYRDTLSIIIIKIEFNLFRLCYTLTLSSFSG